MAKKLQIAFLLMAMTTILTCLYKYVSPDNRSISLVLREYTASLVKAQGVVRGQSSSDLIQSSCPYQNLDSFDPAIMKYARKYPPLECNKGLSSLIYLEGNALKINATKVRQTVGKLDYCRYTPLKNSDQNDSTLLPLKWSHNFLREPMLLSPEDEHLYAECYKNDILVGVTFKSRVIEKPEVEERCAMDYERHVRANLPSETVSVLIVGMDGMSKQNFIRTMPKTRKFVINRLNAKELYKFNKVGDNTFPNVVALLTGWHQKELLRNWGFDQYFDEVETYFLWHHYQRAGYRTAIGFDVTIDTAFHFAKKGWKHPSFDYYIRPLTLQIERVEKLTKKGDRNCVNDDPEVVVLQDYILQLTSMLNNTKTKPYFLYNFYTRLTHDDQHNASRVDDTYLNFFQQLESGKALNNTLVIFFSDHGSRFNIERRETLNGRVEINTPFVFFMFPSWFEKKYPEAMRTFETNQNRLTNFFDINKTLLELLKFNGKTEKGRPMSRGISLFNEIPRDRNCVQADIPPEFCNCRLISNESVSDQLVLILASQLLGYVNGETVERRDICAALELQSVPTILVVRTPEDVKNTAHYLVTIETVPGGGLFEAMLKYDTERSKALVVGDIIRLNQYDGQDWCVDSLKFKPYCFCMS